MPDPITGTIEFVERALPALRAGTYSIRVEQQVDPSGMAFTPKEPLKRFIYDQNFHVLGPRFGLGPADVHALYPPPNSQGLFDTTLPHVVLRRRTLPWEISIQDGEPRRPWLALLVFHQGDLAADSDQVRGASEVLPTAVAGGIKRPQIILDDVEKLDIDKTRVRTIDIPATLFTKIAPTLKELDLLTHVRRVETGDKEPLGMEEDGWFSVVLANRLPQPGLNTAYLVSLDGWADVLANASTSLAGFTSLRMISLASWSFTELPARGNFFELMSKLDVAMLAMPTPAGLASAAASNTDAETQNQAQLLKGALERGYLPLAYDMRQGEHTVAWYRGPLLPVVTTSQDRDPFPTAEAGMIYDARIGMFDVSYAVAWQIGRLLALSDIKFSEALTEWRQDGNAVLDQLLDKAQQRTDLDVKTLFTTVGQIENEKDPEEKKKLALKLLSDLLNPGVFSRRLADLVLTQFEAKLNLQNAIAGTEKGPFRIIAGQNDSLSISAPGGAPVNVKFQPAADAGSVTTTEIIAALNANTDFARIARAARAGDIDGAVAIFSLDPTSSIQVLAGTANTTLGFSANEVSPSRTIVSTANGPYTITKDQNDAFSLSVAGGPPVNVILPAGSARTAGQIVEDLNGNRTFATIAHAQTATNGSRVAISSLNVAADLKILNGSANRTLGFTAGAEKSAPAAGLVKPAPDTKPRLLGATAALIAQVNKGDIGVTGLDAALAIRSQILASLPTVTG